MCRRHQIDATLPYFLPVPLPLTGTLGAFIKIREPFPQPPGSLRHRRRRAYRGFVVLVPLLFLGTALSPAATPPSDPTEGRVVIQLGEPLLFQFAEWAIWGNVNRDWINLHPMAFGAWFGLIATALNLMPFGQLDGGHVSYAVLGRRSTVVSLVTVSAALGLTFVSSSWYAAAGLMVLMLLVFGPRHPRVVDEYEELGRPRSRHGDSRRGHLHSLLYSRSDRNLGGYPAAYNTLKRIHVDRDATAEVRPFGERFDECPPHFASRGVP